MRGLWFVRGEVSGHTAAVLLLLLKQYIGFHLAFLFAFHQFRWCIIQQYLHSHILVEIPFYFINEIRFLYELKQSTPSLCLCCITFSRWDIATKYVNWSTNFRSLALKVEMAPSYLNYMNPYLCLHRGQCLLWLYSRDSPWARKNK